MEGLISIGYSDLFIIALFFLFVGVIGYLVGIRKPTSDQLFFAGKRLNWPVIGFSIIASNISTLTMIGLTADSYVYGISASSYEWMAAPILIILALFITPIYLKNEIKTVPEFFEKRYGPDVRRYFSVVSLIISSAVNIAGPLYAGALLIHFFIPQIGVWEACIGFAIFSAAYTSLGGLSAVVYTDFFQTILFLMISIIVCFALFAQFNFDVNSVLEKIPSSHFEMFNSIDSPYLPWLGLITGVPILGFYFWCTDQVIIQRIIAARNLVQAQRGIFFGATLKLTILFIIVLPGIMALALFPDVDSPQRLYARFIVELIPTGVIGLVLSGLLAAMMSSIDSALNSSATLITYDFIQKWNPQLSDKQLVRSGRISVIIMMIFSLLWTPIISFADGIWAYAQTTLTYMVPPLVTLMLFGIFSRRGSNKKGVITLIVGHMVSAVIFTAQFLNIVDFHFTISATIIFLCSSVTFLLLSINSGALEIGRHLYFSKGYFKISKSNITLSAIIIIATILSILPFLF